MPILPPTEADASPVSYTHLDVYKRQVRGVLPHMIERGSGDIIVTSSLAAHFPTPWEPVYASSKWAIDCFVQTVRRKVFKHGIRAVSYTHLDVYKRQDSGSGAHGRGQLVVVISHGAAAVDARRTGIHRPAVPGAELE